MRATLARSLSVFIIALLLAPSFARAQSGPSLKKTETQPQKKAQPAPTPTPQASDEQDDESEAIKVETNLVTIPVIASDRGDIYVADLRQDEFTIFEDGVQQQVAYFDTVTAPFHVVLMLDTSASTQEKLSQIQRAAIKFTEELQAGDRVKVISFDNQIRDLCDFSSDRAVIQWAIKETRPGGGTKLYDAMKLAIGKLRSIKGRKAIVIFTDGVDSYSDRATYDQNRKALQESGIIVYPIRYETREDVERLARQQARNAQAVDLASILGGGTSGRGTTPKTFPGEDDGPLPMPTGRPGASTGIRWPGGISVTKDKTDDDSNDKRNPDNRDARHPDRQPSPNDTIKAELDALYDTADAYLNDLANETGGSLYRADALFYLGEAFSKIAGELRTQYSVGYYPPQATARDGKYHKLHVKVSRKDVVVRARPGYRSRPAVTR
ncbi:MAG: Ca-activated chloride channel [Blastocatellia bacterium]|jgi:VWFA-related protein|nr:Ca-activated chloride channel [Blastocatellia bacterium]